MSTQKGEVKLKADFSSTFSENDQSALNMSSATSEKTSPKGTKIKKSNKMCAFFQRTWKAMKKPFQKARVGPIVVPDPEAEAKVDVVDAEEFCLPGSTGPEKSEEQLKAEISRISVKGNDQAALRSSDKTRPKVRKSSKTLAFFQRRWKAVKKSFQKNRMETIMILPEPQPKAEVDLADAEQLCVSALSVPEPQVTSASSDHKHVLVDIFRLERRMCQCKVHWTSVTEVWPSVFIGNEETAMDRDKLKEMGISHVINTVAYKEYKQEKIESRAEYYEEMGFTYYDVLVMEENRFDISNNLLPVSEFICKTLSNTDNKLLVHCMDGVSRSASYVLAYLMIHHQMLLEDAIDHIIAQRWIRPNRDFLKTLITLSSILKCQ